MNLGKLLGELSKERRKELAQMTERDAVLDIMCEELTVWPLEMQVKILQESGWRYLTVEQVEEWIREADEEEEQEARRGFRFEYGERVVVREDDRVAILSAPSTYRSTPGTFRSATVMLNGPVNGVLAVEFDDAPGLARINIHFATVIRKARQNS